MNTINRREFARRCAALAAASALPVTALGEDAPKVDENAPQAQALGYRHDAAAVDKAKYANFVEGSNCANCQLYQGGDAWGKCGIFPGQVVNAEGWCSAWVKKAG